MNSRLWSLSAAGALLFMLPACGAERSQVPLERIPYGLEFEAVDEVGARLSSLTRDKVALVLAWSIRCPCVEECARIMEGELADELANGSVVLIAIACEGQDSKRQIRDRIFARTPRYKLVLEVGRTAREFFKFTRAGQVAVLDTNGYVRYRGTLADSLEKPTRFPALEVARAILQGRTADPRVFDAGYGCPLTDVVRAP